MSVFKRWNGTQWETIGPGISSARFENINNMIAPEFDPKNTYDIGDYVVQSDKLYRCINRIGTPQAWNSGNWREVKLGQDVTELRNDVVAVSDTQPTSENNRIWVKPDNHDMKIPLVEDVMMLPNPNDYGENDQIPRSTGSGIEWTDYGLPSDQQTEDAINAWLDVHPEATTTVQDGSIVESKLATSLIESKLHYTFIQNKTVDLISGNFVYINCVINTQTTPIISGEHTFIDCTIGELYLRGGKYQFKNCDIEYIRIEGTTAKFYGCSGHGINLIGNCDNSVIEGCMIQAKDHAPIIISGGVSNNVIIRNNSLINNLTETEVSGIDLQCINTHGVSNSIIENNYCETITPRFSIDLSGHGTFIRSFNNVIRNNFLKNGIIILYATKDAIVSNNVAYTIAFGGVYLNEDYGTIMCTGNLVKEFSLNDMGQDLTNQNIYIQGNVCTVNGLSAYYQIPEHMNIYFVGNKIYNTAISSPNYANRINLPLEVVYINANETVTLPPCIIKVSEIANYPAGTVLTSYTSITNTTMVRRYIVYAKNRGWVNSYWTQ